MAVSPACSAAVGRWKLAINSRQQHKPIMCRAVCLNRPLCYVNRCVARDQLIGSNDSKFLPEPKLVVQAGNDLIRLRTTEAAV